MNENADLPEEVKKNYSYLLYRNRLSNKEYKFYQKSKWKRRNTLNLIEKEVTKERN